MCEPTTIALVATTVITAMTAVYAGQQQKKTNKAIAQQQQQQNDEAAQVKTNQRAKEAAAMAAQVRTSAAESGVSGNSIGAMLDDIQFQSGQDISLINKQRQWGSDATRTELWARNQQATSQMIGGVANAAASGYSQYNRYKIAQQGD